MLNLGINARNGIELVADEINAAGGIAELGGAKINLSWRMRPTTPTTAGTSPNGSLPSRHDGGARGFRVVADDRDLGGHGTA